MTKGLLGSIVRIHSALKLLFTKISWTSSSSCDVVGTTMVRRMADQLMPGIQSVFQPYRRWLSALASPVIS